MRVPKRLFYNETMKTFIGLLILDTPRQNAVLDNSGWQGRRVMGFKIPEWQRQSVWTDEQCVNFIESVYLGANIGSYMLNVRINEKYDNILLDGQQRLRALERYINSEFPVPGEDGTELLWSDLESKEQDHFNRIGFPWLCTEYENEALLKEAYNRHNFSGTPHQAHEMAIDATFKV